MLLIMSENEKGCLSYAFGVNQFKDLTKSLRVRTLDTLWSQH